MDAMKNSFMKSYKALAATVLWAVLAVMLSSSCSKKAVEPEEPELPVTFYNTSGYWKLESWKGESMGDAHVYLYLKNKKFVLKQNVGSMYLKEYTGEYNLIEEVGVGTIIRGIYDYTWDYWSSNYVITSLTSHHMTWVDEDQSENVQKFVRISSFPEE